ncbi:MAG: cytosine deaminase [Conexivisphaerales archaeon]
MQARVLVSMVKDKRGCYISSYPLGLLIKGARLRNWEGMYDVLIEDSTISEISPEIKNSDSDIIEARGRILMPSFTDMHFHLDSALTQGLFSGNKSGTLLEGIEIWSQLKRRLTTEDIFNRASRAVKFIVSNGTTRLRTHADVSDPELRTLKALKLVKEEFKDIIDIQITAFPQDGIFTNKNNSELLEKAVEEGADNIGIIPHNEFTREDGIRSIDFAFDLAKKYGRNIDGHVDETDDEQSRFLEVLAAKTIREGYQGKVAAGHVTAMHSYGGSYMQKIIGMLKLGRITIVANPLVNIHLQGRYDSYPKRRGIARIKQLLAEGINVTLGHDCIMDPWYPMGKGDMLQALFMAVHLEQMTCIDEIKKSFDLITSNPAIALGVSSSYGIQKGRLADLVLLDAKDEVEALAKLLPPLLVIKSGRIVARRNELITSILHKSREEELPKDIIETP